MKTVATGVLHTLMQCAMQMPYCEKWRPVYITMISIGKASKTVSILFAKMVECRNDADQGIVLPLRFDTVAFLLTNAWWLHQMETFSTLLAICAGNSPVTGEFPAQKASDAELWYFLRFALNKRLSKQLWGWWFETPSCPLWRHCNGRYSFLMEAALPLTYRLATTSDPSSNTNSCPACYHFRPQALHATCYRPPVAVSNSSILYAVFQND